MKHQSLTKSASIISRGSNRFFDQVLIPYGIGCGQQFFLSQIAEHEGISMYDLATLAHFDKATVTRAIKKLVELGYVTCETDKNDRRIRHLYTTESAGQLLSRLRVLHLEWEAVLTKNLTPEEINVVCALMEKIAENASNFHSKGEIRNE